MPKFTKKEREKLLTHLEYMKKTMQEIMDLINDLEKKRKEKRSAGSRKDT